MAEVGAAGTIGYWVEVGRGSQFSHLDLQRKEVTDGINQVSALGVLEQNGNYQ